MVVILGDMLGFPDPEATANQDGLVAIGGDLTVERLVVAYQQGIFPWPVFDDDLTTWFSPDPRAILEFDDLIVSRSLRKLLRRREFDIRFDRNFEAVVKGCAEPAPDRPTTWITTRLATAYANLHRAGYAHSVEVWSQERLVGGLYGVAIGGLFAGESMFSRVSNASKVALVHLVEHLRERGFALLDIQQATPHMTRMGASLISRRIYMARLKAALEINCVFGTPPDGPAQGVRNSDD